MLWIAVVAYSFRRFVPSFYRTTPLYLFSIRFIFVLFVHSTVGLFPCSPCGCDEIEGKEETMPTLRGFPLIIESRRGFFGGIYWEDQYPTKLLGLVCYVRILSLRSLLPFDLLLSKVRKKNVLSSK